MKDLSTELNHTLSALHSSYRLCDWEGSKPLTERALRIIDTILEEGIPWSGFPRCYLHLPLSEPSVQALLDRQDNLTLSLPSSKHSLPTPTSPDGRIRITYLSADFRSHSGGFSLNPLLKGHSRDKFIVQSLQLPSTNEIPVTVRDYSDLHRHFLPHTQTLEQALLAMKSDIIVDTTRHLPEDSLCYGSYYAAPIQVSSWGYGGTTSAPHFNYLIGDSILIPQGEESRYREQVIRLSRYHMPPADSGIAPPSEAHPYCFANFNASYKISAELFLAWVDIIRECPTAILALGAVVPEAENNLRAVWKQQHLAQERLHFWPRLSPEAHLQRFASVDFILDSPFLGGGASLSDALSFSIPGVTLSGGNFSERSGHSVLHAATLSGFSDGCYVAQTLSDYREHAIGQYGRADSNKGSGGHHQTSEGRDDLAKERATWISEIDDMLYSLVRTGST